MDCHESRLKEENDFEETKPVASVAIFQMEEEQLEDSVTVDPLADCVEWNERKPPIDSLLLRMKEEEEDAGTLNKRNEQASAEEVKNKVEGASGGDRGGSPSEECEAPKPENEDSGQPFACMLCSETFQYKKTLEGHERGHREEPLLLSGDTWQQRFRDQSTLMCHTRGQIHEAAKEKKFQCESCGKEFKHRCNLTVHLRIHTGEEPYVCDHCGKRFKQRSAFIVHRRIHTGEQPFSCSICNRQFADRSALVTHTRRHLNIKPYGCEECGRTFVQRSHYTQHLQVHTGEKDHKCSICSKTFGRKGDLNSHMFIHSREQKLMSECEVCGDSFKTSYMITHMRTHTREKPFKCRFCKATFATSSNRRRHEGTHTD